MSSAEKSSRKGFKFTKGKKVAQAETLSFEDAKKSTEPASSNVEGGRKRGRSSRNTSIDVEEPPAKHSRKSTDSNLSSGRKDAAASENTVKHRYPVIPYSVSAELSSGSIGNHAAQLQNLVNEICEAEKIGLEEALAPKSTSRKSKHTNSLKVVYDLLREVLSAVPGDVEAVVGKDTLLRPELTSHEKSRIVSQLHIRQQLLDESAKLADYEKNISRLEEDQDLILSKNTISTLQNTNSDSSIDPSLSFDIGIVERYKEILQDINEKCDAILGGTNDAKVLMAHARQQQSKLFDTFNKTRMDLAAESSAPKDTRDLLRQLPNLY